MSTLMRHLSDDTLFEALESRPDAGSRAHIESCASCRTRLDEANTGLLLAREADVPEPSPLYWEAFRRQVGRRIAAEDRRPGRAWLLPLAAAAAAVAFLVPLIIIKERVVPEAAGNAAVLPAWSALPPADEDEGLAVLRGLGVAEADLAVVREGRGMDEALGDLSDEEQDSLTRLLRRGMQEGTL